VSSLLLPRLYDKLTILTSLFYENNNSRVYDTYYKHLHGDVTYGVRGFLAKFVGEDPYSSSATTLAGPEEKYEKQMAWVNELVEQVSCTFITYYYYYYY